MSGQSVTPSPQLSILIAAYDDWAALEGCLESLSRQVNAPEFEVIVVDDGSQEAVPESITRRSNNYALRIVRQPHLGVGAARNKGIEHARGQTLVFTDADCRLHEMCLSALNSSLITFPGHNYFQFHLSGDCTSVVGRAEETRLRALQTHLLQPDGCIRYLNTSGFAVRRTQVQEGTLLFDPVVRRGEDTLLLSDLIQRGELPLFVRDAKVQHVVSLSIGECFRKDLRSAWREGKTYKLIAASGVRLQMRNRDRLAILLWTWKLSGQSSIGRPAWFLLVAREALELLVLMLYKATHWGTGRRSPRQKLPS